MLEKLKEIQHQGIQEIFLKSDKTHSNWIFSVFSKSTRTKHNPPVVFCTSRSSTEREGEGKQRGARERGWRWVEGWR